MSAHFEGLVRQACQVEMKLRDRQLDHRMSAAAIIRDCLRQADAETADMGRLKEQLLKTPDTLRWTHSFLIQAEKQIGSGMMSTAAPSSLARMSLPSRDEALRELGGLNPSASLYTAWAIAVERANQRHPEVFGTLEDPGAHRERIEQLQIKRQELFERIGQEFSQDDLHINAVRSDGWALITMRIAPEVHLMSTNTLGERLITHLLQTDPRAWATVRDIPVEPRKPRVGKVK